IQILLYYACASEFRPGYWRSRPRSEVDTHRDLRLIWVSHRTKETPLKALPKSFHSVATGQAAHIIGAVFEVRKNFRSAGGLTMKSTHLCAVASLAGACVMTLFAAPSAQAKSYKETVLYTVLGARDAANPIAGVIRGAHGDLYGTSEYGGAYSEGTVFKLRG